MLRIKEIRKSKKITAKELADHINVAESTMSLYENGKREPDYKTLLAIANYLDVSVDYLLGFSRPSICEISTPAGKRYLEGDDIPADVSVTMYVDPSDPYRRKLMEQIGFDVKPQPTHIPVYGAVAAGIPLDAIQDIEDYEEITEDMARVGEYAALKIKGNSMLPRFTPGDVVIVKLQDDVDTGDIAIVMVNGDEATCKKIKKTPEGVMLISTNPEYEPMFFTNQEIKDKPVRIWGKVVELRAKF